MNDTHENTDGLERDSESEIEAADSVEEAAGTAAEGENAETSFSESAITEDTSIVLPPNVTDEPQDEEQSDSESEETVSPEDVTGDIPGVSYPFPPNVTIEPQNNEQFHLGIMRMTQDGLNITVRVQDDDGEYIGDKTLEAKVKAYCERFNNIAALTEEDLDKLLAEGPELTSSYVKRINSNDSWSKGVKTKYQIRAGMMLLGQKEGVKRKKGIWTEWFKAKYIPEQLRSAQVYMAVAKIPNIIRYAILGLDRLYEIQRVVKDYRDEDPVMRFIVENGIVFDPSEEVDLVAFKQEIDVALARQKLLDNGLEGVSIDRIKDFVKDGFEIEGKHIKALKLAKKINGDLNQCMEEMFANGGRPYATQSGVNKADAFKKSTDRFMSAVDQALDEDEYLEGITPHIVRQLKLKIENLEARVASN